MIEDGYVRRKMLADPQVRAWARRLEADPEIHPEDLDDEQLTFVMESVLVARKEEFDPSEYERAMSKTTPILAAPEITDWVSDLDAVLRQPEMLNMWARWRAPVSVKGPSPALAQGKALLTVMGMTGVSAHAEDAHSELARDPALRAVFAAVDHVAPTLASPDAFTRVAPYPTMMRVKERVAPGVHWLAMQANIDLVKALRAMYPTGEIGKRLMVDASAIPAWTRQRAAQGKTEAARDANEAFLTRRCPAAGFRMYTYKGKGRKRGKRDVKAEEVVGGDVELNMIRSWRGYYLCVVADQATGLPLVWQMIPAIQFEPRALVPMLSWLYKLWPDIGAELIAGDSAYDEDETCALVESNYGIHPIFRLHDDRGGLLFEKSKRDRKTDDKKPASRDGSVKGITHEGRLICERHGRPLEFETVDLPRRTEAPGRFQKGTYRVRGNCQHGPDPCGRIGLRMEVDWSKLTYYPHYPHGNPSRHAMRLAMLTRLNGIEGIFNRLKCGKNLGTAGADRTRLLYKETHAALISLGLLSMTALTVAHERERRGISTDLNDRKAA